ncbi:transporter [Bradyrhizobium sp. 44]|uniref:SphA family protein n=1 Tax=unclassified Bradyrhizobium TaxID=2631580 RepID=UPI001FF9E286|nr:MULTISPECIES: transporter [unclassified Bradyrhizobium]MCK1288630.1 transporter [Bradyrhizobium sp. 44]UPJ44086.1 transporter [Bradyrhizobium sp. 40]
MTREQSQQTPSLRPWNTSAAIVITLLAALPSVSRADEGGVSYWLPGRFGSLAAAPAVPGWSMAAVYYHTTVEASGAVAAARQIQIGRIPANVAVSLNANLNAQGDLILLNPTYTFGTPVLGGQLAIGVTGLFGRSSASVDGTLTAAVGPLAVTRTGFIEDSITSVGDLYPQATLKWNAGVHNFMTYLTGDIPVGAYSSTRLANLGIGHAAIDAGGGYTYFNPAAGQEFSAVAGFTYNLKNDATNYQNGVDFHVDWGMSQFLSKQFFVGLVGYGYQQITDDFGQHPILGGFRSRVLGIGPQAGILFPVGDMQGYLNLKAYGEFAAENRPSGWNTWLTFSVSPMAPTSTVTATKHRIVK